jgi:undecaprenyl-diphosphatase
VHPTEFELAIFHAINGYAGVSWTLDRIMIQLANNNLIQNGLFIVSFVILWMDVTCDQTQRRAALCFVLIAVLLSMFVNRLTEMIGPFRFRPIYWTDIGMREPTVDLTAMRVGFDNFSSFPSDHAAMFFALVAGFWFISRRLAVVMAIWSAACLLARVFLGVHFPADIIVGAVIGIVVTVAARRQAVLHLLRTGVNWLEMRAFAPYHAAVFLFVFEMGNFFAGLRALATAAFTAVNHIWLG